MFSWQPANQKIIYSYTFYFNKNSQQKKIRRKNKNIGNTYIWKHTWTSFHQWTDVGFNFFYSTDDEKNKMLPEAQSINQDGSQDGLMEAANIPLQSKEEDQMWKLLNTDSRCVVLSFPKRWKISKLERKKHNWKFNLMSFQSNLLLFLSHMIPFFSSIPCMCPHEKEPTEITATMETTEFHPESHWAHDTTRAIISCQSSSAALHGS